MTRLERELLEQTSIHRKSINKQKVPIYGKNSKILQSLIFMYRSDADD